MNLRPRRYWGDIKERLGDDESVVTTPEPEPHPLTNMTDEEVAAWHQGRRDYWAAGVDKDADPAAAAQAVFDAIGTWEPPRNGEVAWQPDGLGGMWIECEVTEPESWRKQRRTGQLHISCDDLPELLRAVRAAGILARRRVEGAS